MSNLSCCFPVYRTSSLNMLKRLLFVHLEYKISSQFWAKLYMWFTFCKAYSWKVECTNIILVGESTLLNYWFIFYFQRCQLSYQHFSFFRYFLVFGFFGFFLFRCFYPLISLWSSQRPLNKYLNVLEEPLKGTPQEILFLGAKISF